jgi:probable phosphoglycerate mutase
MAGRLFEESTPAPKSTGESITAYCDGGSRGNPGPAGYGVSIEGPNGQKIGELSEFLGVKTNNFAEYSALLGALEFALRHGHKSLRVVADSELMVKQIKGQYQVKSPELRPLYEEAKRRIARLDRFEIQHVLRNKNKRADALANEAMDAGTGKTVRLAQPTTNATPAAKPASAPKIEITGRAAPKASPPPAVSGQVYRGFVKNGVVHLLEGELPENAFVVVKVE